jgi:hypothetical protein
VLNRGVGRMKIFSTTRDYEAFEEAVKETLSLYPMRILAYLLDAQSLAHALVARARRAALRVLQPAYGST